MHGRIAIHEAREERKTLHELGEQLWWGRNGAWRDRSEGREAHHVLRDGADVVVPGHDPEAERSAPEHGLLAARARVERARIVEHGRDEREMLSSTGRRPSARGAGFRHKHLLRHAGDSQFTTISTRPDGTRLAALLSYDSSKSLRGTSTPPNC